MTDKLRALLDYQNADIEVEQIERDVLRSDERKKANQMKQKFQNANDDKKRITVSLSGMKDDLKKIISQYEDVIKSMLTAKNKLQQDLADLDQITEIEGSLNKLSQLAFKLESDLTRIESSSAQMDQQLTELERISESSRIEFNLCKEAYENMLEKIKPKLSDAKAKREKLESAVDPRLLTKYNSLKKNNVSPLAKLESKNCSGCHMELPSATIARITSQDNDNYVECENCGRIIYID